MAEDKDNMTNTTTPSNEDAMDEKEIDDNLMETFPASDPPSWTLGTDHREETTEGQSSHPSAGDLSSGAKVEEK